MQDTQSTLLARIGLLSNLSEPELDGLAKKCTWKHYAAQEQIIDRQSDSGDIYFVIDGKVRIANFSLSPDVK